MSGGTLKNLWVMSDWLYELRTEENKLVSNQVAGLTKEFRDLMEEADLYLSGDTGVERMEKAWKRFCENTGMPEDACNISWEEDYSLEE